MLASMRATSLFYRDLISLSSEQHCGHGIGKGYEHSPALKLHFKVRGP